MYNFTNIEFLGRMSRVYLAENNWHFGGGKVDDNHQKIEYIHAIMWIWTFECSQKNRTVTRWKWWNSYRKKKLATISNISIEMGHFRRTIVVSIIISLKSFYWFGQQTRKTQYHSLPCEIMIWMIYYIWYTWESFTLLIQKYTWQKGNVFFIVDHVLITRTQIHPTQPTHIHQSYRVGRNTQWKFSRNNRMEWCHSIYSFHSWK